jgi:hypothetical protein
MAAAIEAAMTTGVASAVVGASTAKITMLQRLGVGGA